MRVNPVLERELRERVRTRGAVVVLTLYLVIVVALFYLVYRGYVAAATPGPVTASGGWAPAATGVRATDAARLGRGIVEWLLFAALALVLFIVPGYTSGAIAGERERQTLIPMQLTLLRPWQIAVGKVAASTAYVGLLLVATLPVLAVGSAFGGVTLGELVRALAAIVVVAVALACVTVACSAVVRRVQVATVLAYACTLLLVFGTLIGYGVAQLVIQLNRAPGAPSDDRAPALIVALNPVIFTGAAMEGGAVSTPLDRESAAAQSATPFQLVRMLVRPMPTGNGLPGSPTGFEWYLPLSMVALAALALLAVRLAAGRLRIPAEIER